MDKLLVPLYILIYLIVWLISLLPLRILYFLSNGLYFLIFYVAGYRKKIVYENLQKSFPEKSPDEIRRIAKNFYKYFCRLIMEIVKLISISKNELKRRIKFRNIEVLTELYNKGKHAVVITGHYGNWEWLTGLAESSPYKVLAVYKPVENKYLDSLFIRMRSKKGVELVNMNRILKAILINKRDGIPTLSFFNSDQSLVKEHIQYWTTFLNQDTPVIVGAEKIARIAKQAVLYCKIIPVRKGYYEVEMIKMYEDVSDVQDFEITEKHVKLLEQIIIEKPEYWLWTHRRWKLSHLRKDFDKQHNLTIK
jgi:Kdo2-lipid IVA lauroyltransferase/acyltransferase